MQNDYIIYPLIKNKMLVNGHDTNRIADAIGISPYAMRRRLKGTVEFELTEIKTLMSIYHCSFDELFGDSTKAG